MQDEYIRLRALRASFERLMHMAGYASAIEYNALQLELTAIALGNIQGEDLMALAETLKTEAANLRTAAEALKGKIDAAVARLSDNPTEADIAAALVDLTAASAAIGDAGAVADNIDPNVPTEGGVNEGDIPVE